MKNITRKNELKNTKYSDRNIGREEIINLIRSTTKSFVIGPL